MLILSTWILVAGSLMTSFQQTEREVTGNAVPLHFVAGCELDLNGDKRSDRALLVGSAGESQLIALLRTDSGYQALIVTTRDTPNLLFCRYGRAIRERRNNDRTGGRLISVPGAYLELAQPEGASAAYVWSDGKFREVWLSD